MLSDFQKSVLAHITSETLIAKDRSAKGEEVTKQIRSAGGYAYALYRDLAVAGLMLEIPQAALDRTASKTGDTEFFGSIDRLTKFVEFAKTVGFPSLTPPTQASAE